MAGFCHDKPVILASLQGCQNNFNKMVANIGLMLVTVRDIIVARIHVERFHVQHIITLTVSNLIPYN